MLQKWIQSLRTSIKRSREDDPRYNWGKNINKNPIYQHGYRNGYVQGYEDAKGEK